ncbi:glycoside hydrolase family 28 protein [Mangrovibacterium lignilyticum]|uniref:glycoside hydrolase family 28 protein n=1 Tax=Mangrovibacterium lignilyticum TaxID=2668052 RepID=UPI0013D67DDF|nr:glycosyl hydrolase family 28 protein [Mangrovibacterium lignilyticum]
MKSTALIGCIFTLLLCVGKLSAKEYNILDYGAVADTSVVSTKAIQQAIDDCGTNGGGSVLVPSGLFKTGSLFLKSHVNLHLETGAVLYGSKDLNDYQKIKPQYISLRTQEATIQLIYAENLTNVSISGFGTIDGQGAVFKKLSWNDEGITRPHLLRFITCRNVLIENVRLQNSGCWMQHYLACEDLQIRGLKIFNRNNYNNDALDLDGCRNVTVSDLICDSDDDGVTLKSTSPRPCENIAITNCVISSRCNAIKMGTESNGGFRNITISNCVVKPSTIKEPTFYGKPTGSSAITLEIVDGGKMEGISIDNIVVDGTEGPIFIRLGNRARTYQKGLIIDHIGEISDVSISQITVRNGGKTACSITGQPSFPVRNISLSDIQVQTAGGGSLDDFERPVEHLPKDYPESTMFGFLPAYGFYVRYAENIQFRNISFQSMREEARPTYFFEQAENIVMESPKFRNMQGGEIGIYMKETDDVAILNAQVSEPLKTLVRCAAAETSNITIFGSVLPENCQKLEGEK